MRDGHVQRLRNPGVQIILVADDPLVRREHVPCVALYIPAVRLPDAGFVHLLERGVYLDRPLPSRGNVAFAVECRAVLVDKRLVQARSIGVSPLHEMEFREVKPGFARFVRHVRRGCHGVFDDRDRFIDHIDRFRDGGHSEQVLRSLRRLAFPARGILRAVLRIAARDFEKRLVGIERFSLLSQPPRKQRDSFEHFHAEQCFRRISQRGFVQIQARAPMSRGRLRGIRSRNGRVRKTHTHADIGMHVVRTQDLFGIRREQGPVPVDQRGNRRRRGGGGRAVQRFKFTVEQEHFRLQRQPGTGMVCNTLPYEGLFVVCFSEQRRFPVLVHL